MRGRRLWRLARWMAWAALATLVIAGIAVWFGWPQEKLAEFLVGRALDATVEVTRLSLAGPVRIGELRVYDTPADRERQRPAVHAGDVAIDYDLFPDDGRYLRSLDADVLILDFDAADPSDTNHDFLIALLNAPATDTDPLAFLPRRTKLGSVDLRLRSPHGSLDLRGLEAQLELTSLEDFSFRIAGDSIVGNGRLEATPDSSGASHHTVGFEDGAVRLHIVRQGDTFEIEPLSLSLPGLLEGKGSVNVRFDEQGTRFTADMPRLHCVNAGYDALYGAFLPVPVDFESLDLEDTRLSGTLTRAGVRDYDVETHATARSLVVGAEGEELFSGDLAVAGRLGVQGGVFEVRLNRGQRLDIALEGEWPSTAVRLALENWSRDDLVDALPSAWRPALEAFPALHALSGDVRLARSADDPLAPWEADVALTPVLISLPSASADTEPPLDAPGPHAWPLAATVSMPSLAAPWPLEASGRISVPDDADAGVRFEARVTDTHPTFDARFLPERLGLAQSASLFPSLSWLEGSGGSVSGSVLAENGPEGLRFELGLQCENPVLAGLALPGEEPVAVEGAIAADADGASGVAGKRLTLQWSDCVNASVTDWRVAFDPVEASGLLSATVDLDELARLVPAQPWTGTLEIHAPIRYEGSVLRSTLRLTGYGVGYGSLMPPPGTATTAGAELSYDPAAAQLSVAGLACTWGERTRLTVDSAAIGTSPFDTRAPFVLNTDLAPLADLALIDSVTDGEGSFEGVWHASSDGQRVELEGAARAAALMLPEDYAGIDNLNLSISCTYDGALEGEGTVSADRVAAVGAFLRNVHGPWRATGGALESDALVAELFGGQVRATAKVDVLESGMPGRLVASLESVDLARFTEEFKPPDTRMTGLADGSLSVQWGDGGLEGLHVDLESTEGFTLNRELLETILLSDLTKTAKGGDRMGKLRARVLGADPQRPFDSANLNLDWVDARYLGTVSLQSEALKLVVDLRVDAEVVAQALALRQDTRLENLANTATTR